MMCAEANAITWKLSALLQGMVSRPPSPDPVITGLSLDSRAINAGDLFIAVAGTQRHGMLFAERAIAGGAAAVVYETVSDSVDDGGLQLALARLRDTVVPMIGVESLGRRVGALADRFYGQPSQNLRVIGVTGTNGKTSCSHFIAQALSPPGQRCGVVGTLGNGLFGELRSGPHTTPDAVTLQALLAEMRSAGARHVVMEVSSHGLAQGRVNSVRFDTAVFTNLSRDHLDYHEDMAAYAQAKQRLFEMPDLRHAVVNIDDRFGRSLLKVIPDSAQAVAYSLSPQARAHELRPGAGKLRTVTGTDLQLLHDGFRLAFDSPWGGGELRSGLLGRFNAANLLAALATLLMLDVELDEALRRLAEAHTVAGRMESYGTPLQPRVVVDYAHTPDALRHVLGALREHCRGRLWCVFGCGGNRDRGKRPLMGAIAEAYADEVVITDDNPRYEDSAAIIADITDGMQKPQCSSVLPDRRTAIRYAVGQAKVGDVVLVAGKGHEAYQQVGDNRIEFSDRDTVRATLAEYHG